MSTYCPHCASLDYLGWTAGDANDGKRLAREIADERHVLTKAVPCAAYGYDVLHVGTWTK